MSEIIESLAGIQAYFYIFADEIFFSWEMNQEIMLGTACKSTLLPVFVFYQDFLYASLETGGIFPALFLYQGKKTAETVFYRLE